MKSIRKWVEGIATEVIKRYDQNESKSRVTFAVCPVCEKRDFTDNMVRIKSYAYMELHRIRHNKPLFDEDGKLYEAYIPTACQQANRNVWAGYVYHSAPEYLYVHTSCLALTRADDGVGWNKTQLKKASK